MEDRMRMMRAMLTSCLFLGLTTGAAIAGGGSGSGAAAGSAGGAAGSAAAEKKPAGGMEMPKPAPQVADAAKMMAGSWKCTGKVHLPDGTAPDVTATVTSKLDLDKMWVHETMVQTKSKQPYKFEAYMTYDAASKKWTRLAVDNMGGWEQTTSDGPDAAGASTWAGQSGGMGMMAQVKTVHTMVNPKEFTLAGTMSMDAGKKWNPSFEMDCKK
jgi:hypothetical protein